MVGSPSTNSLTQPKFSNLKISDQVIEEVDEQMTITSMRAPENRPTAASLFPPASQPVDVPAPRNDYTRIQSFAPRSDQPFTFPTGDDVHPISYLSASAPTNSQIVGTPTGDAYDLLVEDFDQPTPALSEQTLGGAGDDHYIKKLQTNQLDRPNRFLARSVSAQQQQTLQSSGNAVGDGLSRTEMLLDQMSRRNDGLSSSVDNNNQSQRGSDSTPL